MRPAPTEFHAIGRFQLREILGEGAFGKVYRAWDPQLEREVALKVPRFGTLDSKEDTVRFLREARAAAQLRHPNVVAVFESGCIDHAYYIAFDFVAGQTLKETIESGARFSFAQAAGLVAPLARALHYAHTQGVIHRDLKPANVMIDTRGQPRVMDFGLARRLEGEVLRTQEGATLGTPAYMSPEQAQGKSHLADARSDVWGLGVILYELITGRQPFVGNDIEVMSAVQTKDPARPSDVDRSIPRDLQTICLKCLPKDPQQRYPTAQLVADDLERWLRGDTISARPLGFVGRSGRWAKRNPMLASLTSTIIVLLIVAAIGSLVVAKNLAISRSEVSKALETANAQRIIAQKKAREADESLRRFQTESAKRLMEEEASRRILELRNQDADAKRIAEARESEERKAQQVFESQAVEASKATSKADLEKESAMQERLEALKVQNEADYLQRISQAHEAWKQRNMDAMVEYLDACPPEFRAWEWGHLNYVANYEQPARMLIPNSDDHTKLNLVDLAYSSNSQTLVLGTKYARVTDRQLKTLPVLRAFDAESTRERTVAQSEAWTTVGGLLKFFEDPSEPVPAITTQPIKSLKYGDPLTLSVTIQDVRTGAILGGADLTLPGMSKSSFDFDGPNAVNLSAKLLAISLCDRMEKPKPTWKLLVLDSSTGDPRAPPISVAEKPLAISFSPDGKVIAAAGQSGERIGAWSTSSGIFVQDMKVHQKWIATSFPHIFSPDGTRRLSINGGTVTLCDAKSGREILQLQAPGSAATPMKQARSPIKAVRFRPDGQQLAALTSSGQVVLWDCDPD